MARWIALPPCLLLLACAAAQPRIPLNQKVSEIESVVDGLAETLSELDTQLGQTNERITQQTISVSSLIQTQRRQSRQMDALTDSQRRISSSQRELAQKYRALRTLVIQTRLDEIRARIEFLRNRQRELETQLEDSQDAPEETSEDSAQR